MQKTIKINSTLDANITDQMKEDIIVTIEYSEPVDVYIDSEGNKVTGENLIKTIQQETSVKLLKERLNSLVQAKTTTEAEITETNALISEIKTEVSKKIPIQ